MTRYFTHYWSNRTWDNHQKEAGGLLDHTAGNLFRSRHVAPGDVVYVVTVIKGILWVLGKLKVGRIYDADQAARELHCSPKDLWEANDHIIASDSTPMNFTQHLTPKDVAQLQFKSGDTLKTLKFKSPSMLDSQTLRGLRELTRESAKLLDKILHLPSWTHIPNANEITQEYEHEIERVTETQRQAVVKQRIGQQALRKFLLNIYENCCAMCQIDEPKLLRASHIIPWSEEETYRLEPSNAILLCGLHDLAFEQKLLTIDSDYTIRWGNVTEGVSKVLGQITSAKLKRPKAKEFWPRQEFLERHRTKDCTNCE